MDGTMVGLLLTFHGKICFASKMNTFYNLFFSRKFWQYALGHEIRFLVTSTQHRWAFPVWLQVSNACVTVK